MLNPSRGELPVVTLFETYGSGGAIIGRKVAETLGVQWVEEVDWVDAAETAETAEPTGAVEAIAADGESGGSGSDTSAPTTMHPPDDGGLISRIFDAVARGTHIADHSGILPMPGSARADVERNAALVRSCAAQGAVILGLEGAHLLEDHPGALHVRLDGDFSERVAVVAAEQGMSPDVAAKQVRREDRARVETSKRAHSFDPSRNMAYHLVINTSRVDLDEAAELIVAAWRIKQRRLTQLNP